MGTVHRLTLEDNVKQKAVPQFSLMPSPVIAFLHLFRHCEPAFGRCGNLILCSSHSVLPLSLQGKHTYVKYLHLHILYVSICKNKFEYNIKEGIYMDMNKKVNVTFRMEQELKEVIEYIANEERRSFSNQLNVALEEWLKIKNEIHPRFLEDIRDSLESGQPEPVWKG